jgi:hypothetical protein
VVFGIVESILKNVTWPAWPGVFLYVKTLLLAEQTRFQPSVPAWFFCLFQDEVRV